MAEPIHPVIEPSNVEVVLLVVDTFVGFVAGDPDANSTCEEFIHPLALCPSKVTL